MHLYSITEIRELLADITQKKHLAVKTAKNVMNATLGPSSVMLWPRK